MVPEAQISLMYPIARGNCPLTIPTSYDSTQVNGIFDRSMESARYKLGAARAVGHCYAEQKSEKSEPSEMCA